MSASEGVVTDRKDAAKELVRCNSALSYLRVVPSSYSSFYDPYTSDWCLSHPVPLISTLDHLFIVRTTGGIGK